MPIKIRKRIDIEDFIELWDRVYKKQWDKVIPEFQKAVGGPWIEEIKNMFTLLKKNKSYGPINPLNFTVLANSTKNTFLPREIGYPPPGVYISLFGIYDPRTYVKTGRLKRIMSSSRPYDVKKNQMSMQFNVEIPMHSEEPDAYDKLEQSRSYIRSAFILSWPKILKNTLEGIYDG